MKKFPGYRKALKDTSQKTVDDLEKMFQKQWSSDETLNNGDIVDNGDNFEDEIYNDWGNLCKIIFLVLERQWIK